MGVSAHVDFVMAEAVPEPEPAKRIIVLAATKRMGLDEARAHGIEPVAVVTPRSLDAARGVVADSILYSAGLTNEERELLLDHAMPSIATTVDAYVGSLD